MGKVTKNHKRNVNRQLHKRKDKIKKLRARLESADLKTREAILLKLKKYQAAP